MLYERKNIVYYEQNLEITKNNTFNNVFFGKNIFYNSNFYNIENNLKIFKYSYFKKSS